MNAETEQAIDATTMSLQSFETSARGEIWTSRQAADAAAAAVGQVADWRSAGYRGPGIVLVRRPGDSDFELYNVDVIEQLIARRVVV